MSDRRFDLGQRSRLISFRCTLAEFDQWEPLRVKTSGIISWSRLLRGLLNDASLERSLQIEAEETKETKKKARK